MSELSRHLQLLAESSRVRLLSVLHADELTVGELVQVVQMPQSTVSRHLKALLEAGWVKRRTEGATSLYRGASQAPGEAAEAIWRAVLDDWTAGRTHTEDQARLRAVLAARTEEAQTLFARIRAEWDAMRDQLFGPDLLLETLLGLMGTEWVVADLGCGTGATVHRIAPLVGQVHGVDAEPAMLDVARSRCASVANVSLHEASVTDLPLPTHSVDLALAMLVLHHVPDLEAALAEVGRVVRTGGRLLVLDMRAHDRVEWSESLGHAHRGFDRSDFEAAPGWVLSGWRPLRPAPTVVGPPLFAAVLTRLDAP